MKNPIHASNIPQGKGVLEFIARSTDKHFILGKIQVHYQNHWLVTVFFPILAF
jgi:hypothetical protein